MALGRNEKLHLSCEYEGKEDNCPKECTKCAISIKTDGDIAISSNRLSEAIRQYRRALFVEPKFAEAWCNLANAYGMNSEYEKALAAFNKALAIDPEYGKAMFGKALTLRNLGKMGAALSIANDILDLYDDTNVRDFRNELIKAGFRDPERGLSFRNATEMMTNKAYEIIASNNLLDKDGKIHSIQAIYRKQELAKSISSYCKRHYYSQGNHKVWSESVLGAFYGSVIIAMKYYQSPDDFNNFDPFAYLRDNFCLVELDIGAEKLLGIRGDENQTEIVQKIINPFVSFSTSVFREMEPGVELESAVRDAAESAYIMGMLFAMRHHERQTKNKFEHKMHGARLMSAGSGNLILFDMTYVLLDQTITIQSGEIISVVKQLNELFSIIQKSVESYYSGQNRVDSPYCRRLIRYDFCDFNKIYESPLLKQFGKALFPF